MKSVTTLVLACISALSFATQGVAQTDLQSRIEKELAAPKKPVTRSLKPATPDPKAEQQRAFIQKLQTRAIQVIGVEAPTKEERQEIAEIVKDKPKIDLEIFFAYNSADIGPKAVPAVEALGAALSKPDFKGGVFIVNGHTDAAGSAEYNQGLSERRAQSVRKYLIEKFKLEPKTLIAAGFGKEQLKFPDKPLADENRRVQIVNATQ